MHRSILFPFFALFGFQNGEADFFIILGGILTLIMIGFAFGYTFQLYRYTRGGQSAKAWGLLSWAIFLLGLKFIFELGHRAAIFRFHPQIEGLVTFLGVLLLVIGFRHQKRILK